MTWFTVITGLVLVPTLGFLFVQVGLLVREIRLERLLDARQARKREIQEQVQDALREGKIVS